MYQKRIRFAVCGTMIGMLVGPLLPKFLPIGHKLHPAWQHTHWEFYFSIFYWSVTGAILGGFLGMVLSRRFESGEK